MTVVSRILLPLRLQLKKDQMCVICRSQALGIYVTLLWRVLRNDLGLHPYKIKLTQELQPLDHQKRRMFVNLAEQQLENDSDFYPKIIFSDAAHFWRNGFVNKQNMHYW